VLVCYISARDIARGASGHQNVIKQRKCILYPDSLNRAFLLSQYIFMIFGAFIIYTYLTLECGERKKVDSICDSHIDNPLVSS